MAVRNRDQLVAATAASQAVQIFRNGARATLAGRTYSTIDLAGSPGAGVLAGTSTAAGVVPTDATAGCPTINAFSGSNTGYVLQTSIGDTVGVRNRIYDLLFKAGAYTFNAAVTLVSQPSYSSRIPLDPVLGTADYKGTEIWFECVTTFTGNLTLTVTYTNDQGVAGQTTTVAQVTGAAPTVGQMARLPLATGDQGVQKIESVTGTIASAGTFNILVMRQIGGARVGINGGDIAGPDRTGMPILFADSALVLTVTPDSTAIGIADCTINIGNG